MKIFLTTNVLLDINEVKKNFKSKVIENYEKYIGNLIRDLQEKNFEDFQVFQADTILKDLIINRNEKNLFLKKYFLLKEYSILNRENWHVINGIFSA